MGVKLVGGMDTETTGLPGVDAANGMKSVDFVEAIQVCVIPFTFHFVMDRTYLPFNVYLKPGKYKNTKEYKEAIDPALKVNGLNLEKLMDSAMDRYKAADMFVSWWEKVTGSVSFSPLAQNYPFDRFMFIDWLGQKTFDMCFNRYYRDTYGASMYLIDKAMHDNHANPFPDGCSLTKLCRALEIGNEGAHDAMSDVLRTAECYRKMLTYITIPKSAMPKEYQKVND
jgi:DNA polymerase III epsilon subunit-like protein